MGKGGDDHEHTGLDTNVSSPQTLVSTKLEIGSDGRGTPQRCGSATATGNDLVLTVYCRRGIWHSTRNATCVSGRECEAVTTKEEAIGLRGVPSIVEQLAF
jgi:hypothetical protein